MEQTTIIKYKCGMVPIGIVTRFSFATLRGSLRMEGRKKQKGQRQRTEGRTSWWGASQQQEGLQDRKTAWGWGVLENLFQNSADTIGTTSLPKEKSQNPSVPKTSLLRKWDTVSLAHVLALFLWLVTLQRRQTDDPREAPGDNSLNLETDPRKRKDFLA